LNQNIAALRALRRMQHMETADLKFHEAHTWVRQEGQELIIGITNYAQDKLGDVVFVDFTKEVGDTIEADVAFGSVESAKAVEDLIAPVNGEIIRRNDEVVDTPETINDDPYGEGWLIAVKITDDTDLDALLSADEYKDSTEGLGDEDEDEEEEELDDEE
jgi:glycine cleavage system H protein